MQTFVAVPFSGGVWHFVACTLRSFVSSLFILPSQFSSVLQRAIFVVVAVLVVCCCLCCIVAGALHASQDLTSLSLSLLLLFLLLLPRRVAVACASSCCSCSRRGQLVSKAIWQYFNRMHNNHTHTQTHAHTHIYRNSIKHMYNILWAYGGVTHTNTVRLTE